MPVGSQYIIFIEGTNFFKTGRGVVPGGTWRCDFPGRTKTNGDMKTVLWTSGTNNVVIIVHTNCIKRRPFPVTRFVTISTVGSDTCCYDVMITDPFSRMNNLFDYFHYFLQFDLLYKTPTQVQLLVGLQVIDDYIIYGSLPSAGKSQKHQSHMFVCFVCCCRFKYDSKRMVIPRPYKTVK